MGMATGVNPRLWSQTSPGSDPKCGALTNFTVLPSEALVTATAIHGTIGLTGAPVQARVVLTGIRGGCRMDRQCGEQSRHQVCLPGIQTSVS